MDIFPSSRLNDPLFNVRIWAYFVLNFDKGCLPYWRWNKNTLVLFTVEPLGRLMRVKYM